MLIESAPMKRRELTEEELVWADNLRRIWLAKQRDLGLTQETAAEQLGFRSQGAVSQFINAKVPLSTNAKLGFARLLQVPVSTIDPALAYLDAPPDPAPAVAEPRPTYQLADDDEVAILQYDTGGRGGPGLVLRDQPGVIQRWSVSTDWLRANVPHYTSASNLYIVTGFGDSMPDTYNPGDPVLVDTGVTVCDHDGVYFFRVEQEGFIKRLQRIPGQGIRVLSQNKEYEPWTITPDMDFQVFGKVLKAWKGKTY